MNVIARLEYELAYYDSTVHGFNHYTTRTPPCISVFVSLDVHVYKFVYVSVILSCRFMCVRFRECICLYVNLCSEKRMLSPVCVYISIGINVYIYLCISVSVILCQSACMYMWVCVFLFVNMCIREFAYMSIYVSMCLCVSFVWSCDYVCVCVCVSICMCIREFR